MTTNIPTEIERAVVTILSTAYPHHPILGRWVRELIKSPDEITDIDEFAISLVNLSEYEEAGYIVPEGEYSSAVFGAILDCIPKGHRDYKDDEEMDAIYKDDIILRLANALVEYRQAGRPGGDQTHTIVDMGTPVVSIKTSLAAALATYHQSIVDWYAGRIADLKGDHVDNGQGK